MFHFLHLPQHSPLPSLFSHVQTPVTFCLILLCMSFKPRVLATFSLDTLSCRLSLAKYLGILQSHRRISSMCPCFSTMRQNLSKTHFINTPYMFLCGILLLTNKLVVSPSFICKIISPVRSFLVDLAVCERGGVGCGALGDAEGVEVVDLGPRCSSQRGTFVQLGRSAGKATP